MMKTGSRRTCIRTASSRLTKSEIRGRCSPSRRVKKDGEMLKRRRVPSAVRSSSVIGRRNRCRSYTKRRNVGSAITNTLNNISPLENKSTTCVQKEVTKRRQRGIPVPPGVIQTLQPVACFSYMRFNLGSANN